MITVQTESGSTYEIGGGKVTRTKFTHDMRGDGETLDLHQYTYPVSGEQMVIWIRLPDGTETVRTTSRVTSYKYDGGEW